MTTSQHDFAPAGLGGSLAAWPLGGLLLLVLRVAAALSPHSAFAQGRLEAQYEATLAGIPVGKGAWTIDIADDQFSAAASGGTSGLLKAFASGSGTGAAQGRVVDGAPVPTSYTATTTTSKKSEAIHIVLAERQCQGIRHRAGAAGRSGPAFRSPRRIAAASTIR